MAHNRLLPGTETASARLGPWLDVNPDKNGFVNVAFIMHEKKTKQKNTACLSMRWGGVLTLGQKPRGGLDERQHIRAELGQSPSQLESYYMAFRFFLSICVSM